MTEQQPKPLSSRQDVLSFLDDLDSFTPTTKPPTPSTTGAGAGANPSSPKDVQKLNSNPNNPPSSGSASKPEDAQSVLDFLDEITQRSSTPTASIQTKKLNSLPHPLSRKPSSSSLTSPGPNPTTQARKSTDSTRPTPPEPASVPASSGGGGGGGWGWGSVLKQATSNVLNQAINAAGQVQSVVGDPSKSSDLVKHLNENLQTQFTGQSETARKWKEGVMGYVKASGIDQLSKDLQATGLKSLTDIMNAVVPPISEHEIIEVQLSYDMIGYDGIETLVYRSLSKIMEQVDGGDLVLNKGEEEKPKERSSDDPERDLQAVNGMTEGYKLALANLEQMIKRKTQKEEQSSKDLDPSTSQELPITRCSVYIRIQPIISTLPGLSSSLNSMKESNELSDGLKGVSVIEEEHLFFLILLRDLNNSIDHATISQSMPAVWLQIPFEENEWVEEVMVEIIRRGTEVIGQQYVNGRLSGRSVKNSNQLVEEKNEENEKNGQPGLQASTSS